MKQRDHIQIISTSAIAVIFIVIVFIGIRNAIKKPGLEKITPSHSTLLEQSTKQRQFSRLETEKTFHDYTVRIYRNDEAGDTPPSTLQISQNDRIVHRQNGYEFNFGHGIGAEEHDRLIPIGADITGKEIPNLVVTEWSGGAHCCFTTRIFELGRDFREITTIDNKHSDTSHFERRNGEKGLLFITYDFAFAYWRTSFAESPTPRLILRFSNDDYRLAFDLMKKPVPQRQRLEKLAADIRGESSWKSDIPSVALWSAMLDLIYSGNIDSAWQLLDMTWPKHILGRAEFLEDFKKRLATSEYWEEIQLLNAGKSLCQE